jgi:ATP phosphoribosyltransferase regulatory subunit
VRRDLLDTARRYGYELVMPPMLEHLESLLTGTGKALGLQTFKLVDQLSGRLLGLRADSTPQVARIDAHLLNRSGVTRLCYCGPVLHTRPDKPHATREPLQFGGEIYGHGGLEADLEILLLALDCLRAAGVPEPMVDLADVRIVDVLLADMPIHAEQLEEIHYALATKDASELTRLARDFDAPSREALRALVDLYGDATVLERAHAILPAKPGITSALDNLQWLAGQLQDVPVSFDLADMRGYAYYSGSRFSIYSRSAVDAVARGGRYDEVGAAFGRKRPAAGFSLDIKALVAAVPARPLHAAIRAPWSESDDVRKMITSLRARGETVVCVLPGHENEVDEFQCDRELLQVAGQWVVQAM